MTMKLGTTVVDNKDTKKQRNFKGASTKKGFGPVNAPAMGANGSKEQGVIATGGYGADAGGAGGNGGATGGVMASVEGGKMFGEFMESITTPDNTDIISTIMEAYQTLYNI